MHEQSIAMMQRFVNKYARGTTVVDVGSCDVNGTFRPMFCDYAYTGIDTVSGPNVDRVVDPYDYGSEQYDMVISGSTMEHVYDLHAWRDAVIALCKPGGLFCIIAPHTAGVHAHPVDCWRILPDGMQWLFQAMKILRCDLGEFDTCLVARKPLDEGLGVLQK